MALAYSVAEDAESGLFNVVLVFAMLSVMVSFSRQFVFASILTLSGLAFHLFFPTLCPSIYWNVHGFMTSG